MSCVQEIELCHGACEHQMPPTVGEPQPGCQPREAHIEACYIYMPHTGEPGASAVGSDCVVLAKVSDGCAVLPCADVQRFAAQTADRRRLYPGKPWTQPSAHAAAYSASLG